MANRQSTSGVPPAVTAQSFTARQGVIFVESVANRARQLFRPLTDTDVGIDGFIEVCEDGAPAGLLIGVQIKTGPSFVSDDGSQFTFRASQTNFAYWARCHFEVIGVVYDPSRERGVWFDLTKHATPGRLGSGPFSISCSFTPRAEFTADTLLAEVVPNAVARLREGEGPPIRRIPLTVAETEHLIRQGTGTDDVLSQKRLACDQMLDILLDLTSADPTVGQVGNRLADYFEAFPPDQQSRIRERLRHATDPQIVKLLRAVYQLTVNNCNQPAEAVIRLLMLVEQGLPRVRSLLQRRMVPEMIEWSVEQVILVMEDFE